MELLILGISVPLVAVTVCVGIFIFATLVEFMMAGGDGARGSTPSNVIYSVAGINILGNLVSALLASFLILRLNHISAGYRGILVFIYGSISTLAAVAFSYAFFNQGTPPRPPVRAPQQTRPAASGGPTDPTERAHQKVDEILDPNGP